MASNKDLKVVIAEEAKKNEVDVPVTEGKNNAELTEILNGLKNTAPPPPSTSDADSTDADADSDADADADSDADSTDADADAKVEEVKPPYYMAPGKSVTSKKGILADGDEVKAEYFPGGQDTLDNLVKKKYVIKS